MNNFFRALKADEIECRINQISEKRLTLLLYKTARTDADILDEKVGPDRWENDFKLIDGVLYGGLGVDYGSGLVWKWDAGVESNTEAEKGRASDAFKRAGFKHGIGRELYSAPKITIFANAPGVSIKMSNNRPVCYTVFEVTHIKYSDHGKISELKISADGEPCYSWPTAQTEPKVTEKPELHVKEAICERCGKPVREHKQSDGSVKTVKEILKYSREVYGADFCGGCLLALHDAHRNEDA